MSSLRAKITSLTDAVLGKAEDVDALLIEEKEWLNQPDSPEKFNKLSDIYRRLSNGYSSKSSLENFDYSSQVAQYHKLSCVYRDKNKVVDVLISQ